MNTRQDEIDKIRSLAIKRVKQKFNIEKQNKEFSEFYN